MAEPPPAGLVTQGGSDDGVVIPLTSSMSFGSSIACTHILDYPWVAPEHFGILWDRGRFLIMDLDSNGGTFVNGTMLKQLSRTLEDGDKIELAEPGRYGRYWVYREREPE